MSFSNDLMSPSRKYTKKERKGNGQNVIHRQNEGVAQWNSAWLASTRPKIQIPVLKKKKKEMTIDKMKCKWKILLLPPSFYHKVHFLPLSWLNTVK
jgi:hypothetical protein